jgi:hypothetical protein
MTNDINNPFADLEDSSEWDGETVTVTGHKHVGDGIVTTKHTVPIGDVAIPGFVENCPKCGGSGNWRPGYPCFKCKGKGKLTFKTSPEARGKARASAQKRKQRDAETTAAAFDQWLIDECPDVGKWIRSNPGNSFAQNLVTGGQKYGHLTEGQVAGVRKAIARDADAAEGFEAWAAENETVANWLTSEAANGNEFAASLLAAVKRYGSLTEGQEAAVLRNLEKAKAETPSELDISSLKGYYAVPDGDTRLKLCVRKPGKNSRYHGWTFVDDGAAYGNRKTYGKQAPDGLYVGSVQDALKAILADPKEAQIAYGKLTGVCGHCGRILEDADSIAAGIGPVCAAKY